jgi:hypothetical protein
VLRGGQCSPHGRPRGAAPPSLSLSLVRLNGVTYVQTGTLVIYSRKSRETVSPPQQAGKKSMGWGGGPSNVGGLISDQPALKREVENVYCRGTIYLNVLYCVGGRGVGSRWPMLPGPLPLPTLDSLARPPPHAYQLPRSCAGGLTLTLGTRREGRRLLLWHHRAVGTRWMAAHCSVSAGFSRTNANDHAARLPCKRKHANCPGPLSSMSEGGQNMGNMQRSLPR